MDDANDNKLLQDYVSQGSEEAFAELVRRHINLVYTTSLRHVEIAAQAEEITQAVFVILAQKAAKLRSDIVLESWLYETTRLTSLSFVRGERRRQFREQEAYMQSTLQEATDESVWIQLAPLLDEGLSRLGKTDRDAVMLRYFHKKGVRDVAAALQMSETAAQRRILRAIEKLRIFYTKRGVTLTAAAIAGAITANSIQAAPVALANTIAAVAVTKGVAAGSSTLTLVKGALKIMAWTKAKMAVVAGVSLILAVGTPLIVVKLVHSAHEKDSTRSVADLFRTFVEEQKAQAFASAHAEGKTLPSEYEAFFAAAEKGDLTEIRRLMKRSNFSLTETSAEAVQQTFYAFEMFSSWDEKYARVYANEIVNAVPPEGVYFTGVNMGGGLIPAFQRSVVKTAPSPTISLGQLVEKGYRTYLRSVYGGHFQVPTEADIQKCFEDYAPGAFLQNEQNNLERNDFQKINMLVARAFFDQNPNSEFYYEELLPIEWMYPRLEPHGPILKINREPLSGLSDDLVAQDHDYWVSLLNPMVGDWITYDTSVKDVANFTKRVRLDHDYSGFKGDRRYIENTGGQQQIFSKLRTATAGLYDWRAEHSNAPAEKARMLREADFAYRQALALWPWSSESVSPASRYFKFLKRENRQQEANLVDMLSSKRPAK